MMRICKYGDSILKQIAKPIGSITDELKQLVHDMSESMYESQGIGLAAPQVGESIRLFVVDVDWVEREDNPKPRKHLRVFINPEITWESVEDCGFTEGCLSVPEVEGEVYRPERVRVKFQDLKGITLEEEFDSLAARCVQHELDHLNGILFPDRMTFLKRRFIAGQLNRLRNETLAEHAQAGSPSEVAPDKA